MFRVVDSLAALLSARHQLKALAAACMLMVVAACSNGDNEAAEPTSGDTAESTVGRQEVEDGTNHAPCVPNGGPPAFAVDPATDVNDPASVGDVRLEVHLIATFNEPTGVAFRCGDEAAYVIERAGSLHRVIGDQVSEIEVPGLSSEVNASAWEQGLFGIAFAPDGAHLYLSFSDSGNDVRLVEYGVNDSGDALTSRRDILTAAKAHPLHNGGHIAFGPDGLLYWGVGDGESPASAQQLDRLPGSILRLDPSAPDGSIIPSTNPFVGRASVRGEIFIWGLRNPYRFSFDRVDGTIWIGDVGDARYEELTAIPFEEAAGANLGWPAFEGSHTFSVWDQLKAIAPELRDPVDPVSPTYEYSHESGCAVIAGSVYRGRDIPKLVGAFVFGDLCGEQLRALPHDTSSDPVVLADLDAQPTSIAEDPRGELVLLTREPGGLYRVTER